MVKSVLSVSHRGLKDWMMQRLSALIMTIYVVGMVGYLMLHPNLTFADWHALFSHTWVKVSTILVLIGLLIHAWVGMWTIFTDYIKSAMIRCLLETGVLLVLLSCLLWGLTILWSV